MEQQLGLMKIKAQQIVEGQGTGVDKVDLGLTDDPNFANYVAEEGSAVVESDHARSVDTAPDASTDFHAEVNSNGDGNLNYYARATVGRDTSISGNYNIWATGGSGVLMLDSFVALGSNNAGLAVTGAAHIVGAEAFSVQAGKTSVQVGLTGKSSNGSKVGMSASVGVDGSIRVSVGAEIKINGLPPIVIRADTAGGVDIQVPGVSGSYHDGALRLQLDVNTFYNWFKMGMGGT